MCIGALGTVTRTWDEADVPMALVDTGSGVERACLLTAPDAQVGSVVLVHMGYVVEVLDQEEAEDARRLRAAGG